MLFAIAAPKFTVGFLVKVPVAGDLSALSLATLLTLCSWLHADATFAEAFAYVGMDWAKHVVAVGALLGTCVMLFLQACCACLMSNMTHVVVVPGCYMPHCFASF